MMDALTILVLLGLGLYAIKKKLLPRLKKGGRDALLEKRKEGEAAMPEHKELDFCILSFNTEDFTYTEDLAHCVEYELGKTMVGLKKEGCEFTGAPFPVVVGSILLIFLYYIREKAYTGEVEA